MRNKISNEYKKYYIKNTCLNEIALNMYLHVDINRKICRYKYQYNLYKYNRIIILYHNILKMIY